MKLTIEIGIPEGPHEKSAVYSISKDLAKSLHEQIVKAGLSYQEMVIVAAALAHYEQMFYAAMRLSLEGKNDN